MTLNFTNVYKSYNTKELLRRLLLMSLSSNDTLANHSGEVRFFFKHDFLT